MGRVLRWEPQYGTKDCRSWLCSSLTRGPRKDDDDGHAVGAQYSTAAAHDEAIGALLQREAKHTSSQTKRTGFGTLEPEAEFKLRLTTEPSAEQWHSRRGRALPHLIIVGAGAIHVRDHARGGKGGSGQQAPDAAAGVDGNGVQRVINLRSAAQEQVKVV